MIGAISVASPKNPNCVSCVWTSVSLCVSDYDAGVESRTLEPTCLSPKPSPVTY